MYWSIAVDARGHVSTVGPMTPFPSLAITAAHDAIRDGYAAAVVVCDGRTTGEVYGDSAVIRRMDW